MHNIVLLYLQYYVKLFIHNQLCLFTCMLFVSFCGKNIILKINFVHFRNITATVIINFALKNKYTMIQVNILHALYFVYNTLLFIDEFL